MQFVSRGALQGGEGESEEGSWEGKRVEGGLVSTVSMSTRVMYKGHGVPCK